MVKKLFLINPRLAAIPPPHSRRSGLPVHWRQDPIIAIEIQHHRFGMPVLLGRIHPRHDCLQGCDAQLIWEAGASKIFSWSGRPVT